VLSSPVCFTALTPELAAPAPAETTLLAPLIAIDPAEVATPTVVVATLTVAEVNAAPVATRPQPA